MIRKLLCLLGFHKPIRIYDCDKALYYQYKCKHCGRWIMVKK